MIQGILVFDKGTVLAMSGTNTKTTPKSINIIPIE